MNTRSKPDKSEVERIYREAVNTPLRRPHDPLTQRTQTPLITSDQNIIPSASSTPAAPEPNFNDPIIRRILSDSPLSVSSFGLTVPSLGIAPPVSPIAEETARESPEPQEDSFCGEPTQYESFDKSVYSFRLAVTESEISEKTTVKSPENLDIITKQTDTEPIDLGFTINSATMNDNASLSYNSTGTLQYAVEAVPFFDGQNIPVEYFIEGCELAKSMLPPEAEIYLTKIIYTRLTGEARRSIRDQDITRISQLTSFLKSVYGTSKSLIQLYAELGRICQKPTETVLMYANRTKAIGRRILEAHRPINTGTVDQAYRTSLENELVRGFIRGLKPEIEQRIPRNLDVTETVNEALRIEKELFDIREIRGAQNSMATTECQICKKPGHTAEKCRLFSQNPIKPNLGNEILICQICKKRGHSADKCRLWESATQKPVKIVQSNAIPCQICSKPGHIAKNCRSFNNQPSIICRNCQKPGHIARECRSNPHNVNSLICQLCNKPGHDAKNCFSSRNKDFNNDICQWCNRRGHQASQCRERLAVRQQPPGNNSGVICQICNKIGHGALDCRGDQPTSNNFNHENQSLIECRYCKKPGHTLENCFLRLENNRRRQGNQPSSPITGVARGADGTGRPVTAIRAEDVATELL